MFALESLRAVIDGVVTCLRIDDGASVEGEPSRAIVRDATALRGALVDLGRMLDEPEPEDEEEA